MNARRKSNPAAFSDSARFKSKRYSPGIGSKVSRDTHDARAASFADRVVFLKDGRIVDEIRLEHDRAENDPDFGRRAGERILDRVKALE